MLFYYHRFICFNRSARFQLIYSAIYEGRCGQLQVKRVRQLDRSIKCDIYINGHGSQSGHK